MDPTSSPSPLSRLGQTLWAVLSYVTAAVGRYLRPEPPNTGNDDTNAIQEGTVYTKTENRRWKTERIDKEDDEKNEIEQEGKYVKGSHRWSMEAASATGQGSAVGLERCEIAIAKDRQTEQFTAQYFKGGETKIVAEDGEETFAHLTNAVITRDIMQKIQTTSPISVVETAVREIGRQNEEFENVIQGDVRETEQTAEGLEGENETIWRQFSAGKREEDIKIMGKEGEYEGLGRADMGSDFMVQEEKESNSATIDCGVHVMGMLDVENEKKSKEGIQREIWTDQYNGVKEMEVLYEGKIETPGEGSGELENDKQKQEGEIEEMREKMEGMYRTQESKGKELNVIVQCIENGGGTQCFLESGRKPINQTEEKKEDKEILFEVGDAENTMEHIEELMLERVEVVQFENIHKENFKKTGQEKTEEGEAGVTEGAIDRELYVKLGVINRVEHLSDGEDSESSDITGGEDNINIGESITDDFNTEGGLSYMDTEREVTYKEQSKLEEIKIRTDPQGENKEFRDNAMAEVKRDRGKEKVSRIETNCDEEGSADMGSLEAGENIEGVTAENARTEGTEGGVEGKEEGLHYNNLGTVDNEEVGEIKRGGGRLDGPDKGSTKFNIEKSMQDEKKDTVKEEIQEGASGNIIMESDSKTREEVSKMEIYSLKDKVEVTVVQRENTPEGLKSGGEQEKVVNNGTLETIEESGWTIEKEEGPVEGEIDVTLIEGEIHEREDSQMEIHPGEKDMVEYDMYVGKIIIDRKRKKVNVGDRKEGNREHVEKCQHESAMVGEKVEYMLCGAQRKSERDNVMAEGEAGIVLGGNKMDYQGEKEIQSLDWEICREGGVIGEGRGIGEIIVDEKDKYIEKKGVTRDEDLMEVLSDGVNQKRQEAMGTGSMEENESEVEVGELKAARLIEDERHVEQEKVLEDDDTVKELGVAVEIEGDEVEEDKDQNVKDNRIEEESVKEEWGEEKTEEDKQSVYDEKIEARGWKTDDKKEATEVRSEKSRMVCSEGDQVKVHEAVERGDVVGEGETDKIIGKEGEMVESEVSWRKGESAKLQREGGEGVELEGKDTAQKEKIEIVQGDDNEKVDQEMEADVWRNYTSKNVEEREEDVEATQVAELHMSFDAPTLDFTAQKFRISVKNQYARPPSDPRTLLQMPSLLPTPSTLPQLQKLSAEPEVRGKVGVVKAIGIPLPGGVFPLLKKTERGERVIKEEDTGQIPAKDLNSGTSVSDKEDISAKHEVAEVKGGRVLNIGMKLPGLDKGLPTLRKTDRGVRLREEKPKEIIDSHIDDRAFRSEGNEAVGFKGLSPSAVKLLGCSTGFPKLRKTERGSKIRSGEDMGTSTQKLEAELHKNNTCEGLQSEAPSECRPLREFAFGSPHMMSELKNKLKKTERVIEKENV